MNHEQLYSFGEQILKNSGLGHNMANKHSFLSANIRSFLSTPSSEEGKGQGEQKIVSDCCSSCVNEVPGTFGDCTTCQKCGKPCSTTIESSQQQEGEREDWQIALESVTDYKAGFLAQQERFAKVYASLQQQISVLQEQLAQQKEQPK
jgi:hypothetical protein